MIKKDDQHIFVCILKDLSVMTEPSSHMRHDDMFLKEHSSHQVNTYE